MNKVLIWFQPEHQPAPQPEEPTSDQLTASMLAGAPPQEQKQMLGERLYPHIQVNMNAIIKLEDLKTDFLEKSYQTEIC